MSDGFALVLWFSVTVMFVCGFMWVSDPVAVQEIGDAVVGFLGWVWGWSCG